VIRPAVNLPGRQPRYNIGLLAQQLVSQEESGVCPAYNIDGQIRLPQDALSAIQKEAITAKLERQRKLDRFCAIFAEQLLKAAQILREETSRQSGADPEHAELTREIFWAERNANNEALL
jgi:hypothetical protein